MKDKPKNIKKISPANAVPPGRRNKSTFNMEAFKAAHANKMLLIASVLFILLCISLFKNISYPLFWADESMTAMCSERVVNYGYPKVHDGKNVLNDMYCSTPDAAVNKKDDAFIGGSNWGQYYFGAIGYLLASKADDMYTQTGIFRSTFATIGLIGLLLLALTMSMFLTDKFYKYLFIALFLLAELISLSVVLHLREVRYYSPALFFSSSIISLYVLYKFYKPFNKIIFSIALAALLWIVFNMFSPLYFILISAIGISETVMAAFQYMKIRKLKESVLSCLPAFAAIAISCIGIYPLLVYFKTFEMKKTLDAFYQFDFAQYQNHFSEELRYFRNLEPLWLAVALRAIVLLNFKKALQAKSKLLRVSNFLSLLFLISLFSIPDIDSGMFVRYFIYMQPVLVIIAIFDFIFLLKLFSEMPKKTWYYRPSFLVVVFTGLFGFTVAENLPYIKGHIYEMTHQYKGPLDYTIPYIKSTNAKPEDLIIAANYEETTYMYYLKSKVIVGFIGNNMPQDTLYQPQIISFRQFQGIVLGSKFVGVFNSYIKKATYKKIFFPVKDLLFNNLPELNADQPVFDHYFRQPGDTTDKSEDANLLIKI